MRLNHHHENKNDLRGLAMIKKTQTILVILFIFYSYISHIPIVWGSDTEPYPNKWIYQEVYIPIYSAVFAWGDDNRPLLMSANIIVGNTDDTNSIVVSKLAYYNSDGKLIKQYITKPIELGPMASTYFLIRQQDTSGGWGANFILEWSSKLPVKEPFTKALFMGNIGNQSFSFDTQGKIISCR